MTLLPNTFFSNQDNYISTPNNVVIGKKISLLVLFRALENKCHLYIKHCGNSKKKLHSFLVQQEIFTITKRFDF